MHLWLCVSVSGGEPAGQQCCAWHGVRLQGVATCCRKNPTRVKALPLPWEILKVWAWDATGLCRSLSSCITCLRLFFPLVCRRWKRILQHPASLQALFSEVCIDFGHEVITAVHTPIAWSDRRPSDDEFRDSFAVRACAVPGCADGVALTAGRVGYLGSKDGTLFAVCCLSQNWVLVLSRGTCSSKHVVELICREQYLPDQLPHRSRAVNYWRSTYHEMVPAGGQAVRYVQAHSSDV